MYRITVSKKGFIIAVYFNSDPVLGEEVARMEHGGSVEYRVDYGY